MPEYHELGMVIEKDVPVTLRDGHVVRANVFRPEGPGRWPVVMNYGPYGKDIHFSEFMPGVWEDLQANHRRDLAESSLKHLTFESADPEMWTRRGYAVVRVDSRGAGKSPGLLNPNSPDEFRDAYDAVEWAGAADWCNGKVGLLGISYYAAGQWMIAAQRPPSLAAIQPWQGTSDFYRDRTRQGGMFNGGFVDIWWRECVVGNQHGNAESPYHDYFTQERNTGPALTAEECAANRIEYVDAILDHPLEDEWYRSRSAQLAEIDVPALVVANWGGLSLHLRGTVLGYEGIASQQKWLRIETGSYLVAFYQARNVELQARFFDRFLKSDQDAWTGEPAAAVVLRSMDDAVSRIVTADEWPLPGRTEHRLYLDATKGSLDPEPPATDGEAMYLAREGEATFSTGPIPRDLDIVGAMQLTLTLTSSTEEADLFVTLQAFDADGTEARFVASGHNFVALVPLSQGWLRGTHRQVDPARSGFLRPFHTHQQREPLVPGEPVTVEIELWPGSLALTAGSELRLTVSGHDFQRSEGHTGNLGHEHPRDRPDPAFAGTHTIRTGPASPAYLSLPELLAPA